MQIEFKLDNSGFPLIWVDEIKAFVHWLPITKIQIEYFICSITDNRFDGPWYDEILNLNGRVSPQNVNVSNYWNIFLTGLKPDEALLFAKWNGANYSIPTLKEWNTIYKTMSDIDGISNIVTQMGNLKPRVKQIAEQMADIADANTINSSRQKRLTLADQMFMRNGVMEWVELDDFRNRWGGIGEPNVNLQSLLVRAKDGQPLIPNNAESLRIHYYGTRLVWRQS